MPKLNFKRSIEYIRRALIHLQISLEAHNETKDLSTLPITLISKSDEIIARKNELYDNLARAMALLSVAEQNLDTAISVINMNAKMADKLTPGHNVQNRLFPERTSKLLKKTGKGIKEIMSELERIESELISIKNELSDFEKFYDTYVVAFNDIKSQMDTVDTFLEEEDELQKDIEEFKKDVDNLYLDLELHLTRIYKRNRKMISSFFKI